jgi:ribonuclease III
MQSSAALEALTRRLAYSFNNPALLDEALTHRSVGARNNERLEFLGDSVLNFVIADELFQKYSTINEGDLSRLRASLVNRDSLADIARELELGACLKLGSGELKSGGFRRSSIIADAVESILGAVYCDSGFDACRQLVLRLFKYKLDNIPDIDSLKDAKTRLQELLQSRRYDRPEYEVVEVTGKAHAQNFKVECRMQNPACVTVGEGRSRRKAEQLAAEAALEILHQQLKG